ncbi:MAG TPA: signal peptidase I [Microbacterium sp.]|uniref:signal peptidase I n=1 Tax=Microbacterium sp. TaxID=51671 RepID=UPI002C8D76A8|nr:signal peptidase I [Microbacterium sp.]HWI32048.1 signal peptidase I [Microbacterium sp.]
MHTLRRLSLAALWVLAVVGIACGLVWAATAAGIIKPLVVISGSMEPGIMTGDLLVATRVPATDLRVGDVVSLQGELTDNLVTHRIEKIQSLGDENWAISMKGDNNEFSDALDYQVMGAVWKPAMQLSGWGTAIMRMGTPAVALPLVIGLLGLLGLTLLIPAPVRVRTPRRVPATEGAVS